MKVRLVCMDVDGTLVGTGGKISPRVWDAADKARAAGLPLVVCSGRPGFGITRTIAERLDPKGWHAFQNGASVLHLADGRSLSVALAPETIRLLRDRARETGRDLELYTDTEYAVESTSDRARRHADLLGVPFRPRSFDSLAGRIVRGQWLVPHAELDAVLAEPNPGLEVSPSTSPVMPDTNFVNLTPKGVNKATAVRQLAAEHGARIEEVMFVGDGHNDMDAMQIVGFPVAVGNATPEVKALAKLRVPTVDEGGVADALAAAMSG